MEEADTLERMSNILRIISHPARLQILEILVDREACVCHLVAILNQRQAYVSQHLMKLGEEGTIVPAVMNRFSSGR